MAELFGWNDRAFLLEFETLSTSGFHKGLDLPRGFALLLLVPVYIILRA